VCCESSGQQNESNHDESNQRSDEETQNERQPVFLAPQILHEVDQASREVRKSHYAHFYKVSAARHPTKKNGAPFDAPFP